MNRASYLESSFDRPLFGCYSPSVRDGWRRWQGFFVKLDDVDAEWLAAKIDDSKPTLRDVAQAILMEASQQFQGQVGHTPCQCGALERLSSEENSPVMFDAVLNEYQLLRATPHGPAEHRIRYCLWCGGRAPASRRADSFAKVDHEEVRRLNDLCAGIRTFQDAVDRFGRPQSIGARG